MKAQERGITLFIKGLFSVLCRIQSEEIRRVPGRGPLIVVFNHINFLEAPLLYTYIYPRPQTSFVKAESYENPFLGYLAKTWDAIPVRRGTSDFTAFRAATAALEEERLLLIAPEGTRSGDGRLRKGKTGVVHLAVGGDYPILPLVHYGGEQFYTRIRRGRRTDFTFRVGKPLKVDLSRRELTASTRQAVTDEIMTALASLLPPRYRGYYADAVGSPPRYLRPLAAGPELLEGEHGHRESDKKTHLERSGRSEDAAGGTKGTQERGPSRGTQGTQKRGPSRGGLR